MQQTNLLNDNPLIRKEERRVRSLLELYWWWRNKPEEVEYNLYTECGNIIEKWGKDGLYVVRFNSDKSYREYYDKEWCGRVWGQGHLVNKYCTCTIDEIVARYGQLVAKPTGGSRWKFF